MDLGERLRLGLGALPLWPVGADSVLGLGMVPGDRLGTGVGRLAIRRWLHRLGAAPSGGLRGGGPALAALLVLRPEQRLHLQRRLGLPAPGRPDPRRIRSHRPGAPGGDLRAGALVRRSPRAAGRALGGAARAADQQRLHSARPGAHPAGLPGWTRRRPAPRPTGTVGDASPRPRPYGTPSPGYRGPLVRHPGFTPYPGSRGPARRRTTAPAPRPAGSGSTSVGAPTPLAGVLVASCAQPRNAERLLGPDGDAGSERLRASRPSWARTSMGSFGGGARPSFSVPRGGSSASRAATPAAASTWRWWRWGRRRRSAARRSTPLARTGGARAGAA